VQAVSDQFEQPGPRVGPFWQESDAYHGVVHQDGERRLIISPNGSRYAMQHAFGGAAPWVVTRWRKSLALLVPDLPAGLVGPWLDGLPDDPRDFVRRWAEETKALSDRFKATRPWRDNYSGVLARCDALRVVLLPDGRRYAAQIKGHDGRWVDACVTPSSDHLFAVACGGARPSKRAQPLAGSAWLSVVAQRLPQWAEHARGVLIETPDGVLSDVSARADVPKDRTAERRAGRKTAPQARKRAVVRRVQPPKGVEAENQAEGVQRRA